MKRIMISVLLAFSASFAAEPKYSLLVQGLLPRAEAPSDWESSLGFGAMAAVEARFDISEKLTIAPFIGFEYILHGVEAEEDGAKAEMSLKSRFLPIGMGVQLAVTPALKLAFTPEIDVTLGGSGTVAFSYEGESYESDEKDIKDDQSPFLIGLGIVYGETDKVALVLGYKFATSDYIEDYKLNKFYLGGRFAM